MSTDTAQLDSLTQRLEHVATNLHAYLEERARELAEPYIAVAEELANRRIAEAEAGAQRERDLVAELRRQLTTREQQLIRAEHQLGKTHNPGNCEQCDTARRADRGLPVSARPRELCRGEQGGFPFWHDEGGNTVRIAPSEDGGVHVWVTEDGMETGPRLAADDTRDLAEHLLQLCDRIDTERRTPARCSGCGEPDRGPHVRWCTAGF